MQGIWHLGVFSIDTGSTAQRECEPSCTICLDVNHSFPDLFGFSRGAENKNNDRFWCPEQRMRTERGLIRKIGQKRLSCGPTIFAKKLQKSRETHSFTAFHGGPDRIRTDDPYNANVVRSQLRYRPIFSYFVYFSLICLCSLLF